MFFFSSFSLLLYFIWIRWWTEDPLLSIMNILIHFMAAMIWEKHMGEIDRKGTATNSSLMMMHWRSACWIFIAEKQIDWIIRCFYDVFSDDSKPISRHAVWSTFDDDDDDPGNEASIAERVCMCVREREWEASFWCRGTPRNTIIHREHR